MRKNLILKFLGYFGFFLGIFVGIGFYLVGKIENIVEIN
jgi:hypothetical protein